MGISQQIGASSLIKPGVIDNTAARPAAPYEGQVIYETDTDLTYVWSGAAWVSPSFASPTFTGTVLKTGQPIIAGQIGSYSTQSADSLIQFDDFWVSRGITYNSSTRRFTVPTTGVYRITMNPFFNSGAANCRLMVGVNTDSPTTANHRGHVYREAATYDTGNINSVVSLTAGDYIVFRLQQGSLYNTTSDRFTQFSIELIG